MTRRATLFLVCAFEIALLLFMAAWSAQAREVYVFHCNLNLTHDVTVDGKTTIHRGGSTDQWYTSVSYGICKLLD